MMQPLRKTELLFLKILNVELPYDPAIPLLGTYAKEWKAGPQRDVCTPMCQNVEATQVPTDGWINKTSRTHTQWKITQP